MHRRQGCCRQSETASLRLAWWLALLLGGATSVGAWLSVGTAAPQQATARPPSPLKSSSLSRRTSPFLSAHALPG